MFWKIQKKKPYWYLYSRRWLCYTVFYEYKEYSQMVIFFHVMNNPSVNQWRRSPPDLFLSPAATAHDRTHASAVMHSLYSPIVWLEHCSNCDAAADNSSLPWCVAVRRQQLAYIEHPAMTLVSSQPGIRCPRIVYVYQEAWRHAHVSAAGAIIACTFYLSPESFFNYIFYSLFQEVMHCVAIRNSLVLSCLVSDIEMIKNLVILMKEKNTLKNKFRVLGVFIFNLILLGVFLAFSSLGAGSSKRTR